VVLPQEPIIITLIKTEGLQKEPFCFDFTGK